jgi:hypothetical protein
MLTKPHVDELLVVRDAVRDFEKVRSTDTRLVIVRPSWSAQMPTLIRYDLIGSPASFAGWAAIPLVKDVYREFYRRSLPGIVIDVPARERDNLKPRPNDYVMNLDQLLSAYAQTQQLPIPSEGYDDVVYFSHK